MKKREPRASEARGFGRWKKLLGKRSSLLVFSLLLAVIITLGSTLAWFVSSDKIKNPFATPPTLFEFEVVDIFEPPVVPPGPGTDYEKIVGAKNVGDLPGFVRLQVTLQLIAPDNTVLDASDIVSIKDLNTTNWKDGGDGWYYYLDKLDAGQTTPYLFTQVHFANVNPADLAEDITGAHLTIDVKMEHVETAKWKYRETWWGLSTTGPAAGPLKDIDDALAPKSI
jgi:hypothetical protein